MKTWPEFLPPEPHSPARRENYLLRQRIDDVLAFVKPPQKMSLEQAVKELELVGTPHPVIDRLIGGLVEYRK